MTTPRPPFPDDFDTVTPMTEEERLWRLEQIKASIREALDNPGELISVDEMRRRLENDELEDEFAEEERAIARA